MDKRIILKLSGFSLLEVLVAMSLLSMSGIIVMQAQRFALAQARVSERSNQAAIAQASLAERLKSCFGDLSCQHREIQRWQEEMASEFPYFHTAIVPKGSGNYEIRFEIQSGETIEKRITFQFMV